MIKKEVSSDDPDAEHELEVEGTKKQGKRFVRVGQNEFQKIKDKDKETMK